MSTQSFEIEKGKQVVRIEAQSLAALVDKIDASFEQAVRIIFEAKGRIVVTGVGKSGIIARKIVATMNSTGTRQFSFIRRMPSMATWGWCGGKMWWCVCRKVARRRRFAS